MGAKVRQVERVFLQKRDHKDKPNVTVKINFHYVYGGYIMVCQCYLYHMLGSLFKKVLLFDELGGYTLSEICLNSENLVFYSKRVFKGLIKLQ